MSGLNKSVFEAIALALIAITSVTAQSQTQQTSAATQQTTPQTQVTQSDLTLKARAQVVLLDVVATDHKGRPITDLKKEDFTVTENGQPQQIASFSMMDVAKHTPPPGLRADKLPPGVYSNHPDVVMDQGQLIVLLLDALNTQWKDQAYMRWQMLKYLAKNHQKGQRMAIFGLSRTLIRLQDFTDDPEKLTAVIKKHKGDQSPLLDASPDIELASSDPTMQAAVQSFLEEQTAAQMDLRVRMTLDALRAIGRMLQGYPGRKKLLWVSGSFPVSLEPGEYSGFQSQRTYADDILQTTQLLRDGQVSVYPIDPSGLVTLSAFDASTPSRSRNQMQGSAISQQITQQLRSIALAQQSAKQIAEDTGGVAFYNRNDLDVAVMKSVDDGAIYYEMSYSPINKNWDGKVRHIDVKVNRPNVELRYRKSYTAIDPDQGTEENKGQKRADIGNALNTILTSSAVTFYGSAQPLQAPAKTGSSPNNAAIKLADIRFLVQPEDVMFHPKGDRRHCNLEFVAADFVGDRLAKSATNSLDCNVEPATYQKLMTSGIVFRLPLEVVDGSTRVRLLVRDNLTGKMGTLDIPYKVGDAVAPP